MKNLSQEKLLFIVSAIEGKPAGTPEVAIIKGELLIEFATPLVKKTPKPDLKEVKP